MWVLAEPLLLLPGSVTMWGALQGVGLTRSREAAKGNAKGQVFSFRFSVFGLRFAVGRAAGGSPRVWVLAGRSICCRDSVMMRGLCRQLVSREAAKGNAKGSRNSVLWYKSADDFFEAHGHE